MEYYCLLYSKTAFMKLLPPDYVMVLKNLRWHYIVSVLSFWLVSMATSFRICLCLLLFAYSIPEINDYWFKLCFRLLKNFYFFSSSVCFDLSCFPSMQRSLVAYKQVKVNSLSHVWLCDPKDCSLPGSSSMEFSRQEYWSGLPFPSLVVHPNPEIEPGSPTL